MANYVSSLTGQQINDVMTQIDQGVPEGWAVGEKNGVPVSSSSVYYHNNAKYYAESAQGSAARAEAAVPASTAGAVFFDRTQSLTDAQKGQAKSNIGAGSTNPNLLDNWYFASGGVVNQRGTASGTFGNNLPVVDRWFSTFYTGGGDSSWTLTSDGLQLTLSNNADVILKQQYNPIIPLLTGKTLIISVELSNGLVYSSSPFVRTTENQGATIIAGQIVASMRSDNTFWLRFYGGANGLTIKAVKLEVGEVSTLANDAPPNYALELEKCQRIFFRLNSQSNINVLGFGNAGAGVAIFLIPTPTTMRANPTVTATNIGNLQIVVAGITHTPTAISVRNVQANGIMITATCSTVSGSDLALLRATASGATLDFSTDIA